MIRVTHKPGFMDARKWEELFKPYSVFGGELLVAKLGDPPGSCAIYPHGIGPAMVTPDVIKMEVDQSTANPLYLMYFFNSLISKKIMFGLAFGVTRSRIDLPMFKSLSIPVPPLPEQQEIVRQVESLFALAEQLEARLAAAQQRVDMLRPSLLAKAFHGELVPTEADLADAEGREFESAGQLLTRLMSASHPIFKNGAGSHQLRIKSSARFRR
jgi:type I restriction enzyme S subunit